VLLIIVGRVGAADLTTTSGSTYRNITPIRSTQQDVTLSHDAGIVTIKYRGMSEADVKYIKARLVTLGIEKGNPTKDLPTDKAVTTEKAAKIGPDDHVGIVNGKAYDFTTLCDSADRNSKLFKDTKALPFEEQHRLRSQSLLATRQVCNRYTASGKVKEVLPIGLFVDSSDPDDLTDDFDGLVLVKDYEDATTIADGEDVSSWGIRIGRYQHTNYVGTVKTIPVFYCVRWLEDGEAIPKDILPLP
jgi:hypothetical protein